MNHEGLALTISSCLLFVLREDSLDTLVNFMMAGFCMEQFSCLS